MPQETDPSAQPEIIVSVDEMYPNHTSRIDTQAFAAFCDTDGCTWRGDWHHADDATESAINTAHAAAEMDAEEHELSHHVGA